MASTAPFHDNRHDATNYNAHLIEPSNLLSTKLFTYLFVVPQGVSERDRDVTTNVVEGKNVCRHSDYTLN